MIINYLHESGPFGSYKSRSQESIKKAAVKDLEHIAKTALLDNLSTKIGDLLKEHLDKKENLYIRYNMNGLTIVGKNGNKKSIYGCWNAINGSWNNAEDATPIFRLVLEKNTIVVIMSCIPYKNYQISLGHTDFFFSWIKSLKKFLNSNINRITETELPFSYDGFDVKIEIDPDILDNNGRVNVNSMIISQVDNINEIQNFVNYFYNQNIRIKVCNLAIFESMSSNEMHQQYIKRFPDLIRTTGVISLDMNTMDVFDLENLNIISVLADPHSDVEIKYKLELNKPGVPLQKKLNDLGIEKFIHNEYNITLEELKEIACRNKPSSAFKSIRPEDINIIKISYKYNNPRDLTIKGFSKI